jgi:hypothetical protein
VNTPRSASGISIVIGVVPQITLISSSPMIMPPIVIRICFRCWPYTGRTSTRSKAQPTAPAASIATSIVANTGTRLRHSSADVAQPLIAASTVVAR